MIITSSLDVEACTTLWLAACSSSARSVSECVQKTRELLDSAGDTNRALIAEWLGKQVVTVYLNRGNDEAVVSALFEMDEKPLTLGCLGSVLSIHMRGIGPSPDVPAYLNSYATRYGEDNEYLLLKLRWLTLYPNYPGNETEVERILGVLSGEAA